jgi:hypothetical protein
MATPTPATSLRDIRRVCKPGPLTGEEIDSFWENTDAARDPERSVRTEIQRVLGDRDVVRMLVYGHRGCGKSTELQKLVRELGAGWFVVRYSVHEDMPPVGVRAEDVLLSIASRLVHQAKDATPPLDLADADLKPVHDYFSKVVSTATHGRESEVAISAGAKVKAPGLLAGLIDMFAGIRSDLKFAVNRETTVVSEVRKRPAELVHAVNALVEAVRAGLRPREERLLIVVEDLDKLSLADARQVFILNAQLLASVNACIVYTIPLFTFHSPEAGVLSAQFDHTFSLPMVKVVNPDGTWSSGHGTICDLVKRRLAPNLIEDDALKLLVEKTGGVLRHVFEVLNTVSLMASLRQPPIRREHIDYGLTRLRGELATQIALPPDRMEGLDSVKQLHDWLCEAAKRQRAGKPLPRTGEPIVQVLLQSCALVEYNGRGWLGVHPLVQDYLVELGYQL